MFAADLNLGFRLATEILCRTSDSSQELRFIDLKDRQQQQSALMIAAGRGNTKLVDLLLRKGASLGFNINNESEFFLVAGVGEYISKYMLILLYLKLYCFDRSLTYYQRTIKSISGS